MTTCYTIKDAAALSGFTAATLRYYEQLGLVSPPVRTSGGYRLYDDRSIEQLAFIARAKQLGCTLDEINDLIAAWEGDLCGPVQGRLRSVVADKLNNAKQHIAELTTLTSQLQQAAAALELHRPDGPCDERCGCVSDPATDVSPLVVQLVPLMAKPTATGTSPTIACTLSAGSMQERLDEWRALFIHVDRRESVDSGLRLTLNPSVPLADLIRLTAAEHGCCQFIDFAITIDARGIALEICAAPDALGVVQSLFGGEQSSLALEPMSS